MTEREKPISGGFGNGFKEKRVLMLFVGFCEFEGKNRPLRPGGVTMWQLESTPH